MADLINNYPVIDVVRDALEAHDGKKWTARESTKLAARLDRVFGGPWRVWVSTIASMSHLEIRYDVASTAREVPGASAHAARWGAQSTSATNLLISYSGSKAPVIEAANIEPWNRWAYSARDERNDQRRAILNEQVKLSQGPRIGKLAAAIDAYKVARAALVAELGDSFDGPFSADYYTICEKFGIKEVG